MRFDKLIQEKFRILSEEDGKTPDVTASGRLPGNVTETDAAENDLEGDLVDAKDVKFVELLVNIGKFLTQEGLKSDEVKYNQRIAKLAEGLLSVGDQEPSHALDKVNDIITTEVAANTANPVGSNVNLGGTDPSSTFSDQKPA